jgi:hypothetical protein
LKLAAIDVSAVRLRRHAGQEWTRAAEQLAVDDRDARAALPGEESGGLAGLAGADDHEVVGVTGRSTTMFLRAGLRDIEARVVSAGVGVNEWLLTQSLCIRISVSESDADSMALMPDPLLPAIDAAGQLREAAFALLFHKRRPAALGADSEIGTACGQCSAPISLATILLRGAIDWAGCASAAARLV